MASPSANWKRPIAHAAATYASGCPAFSASHASSTMAPQSRPRARSERGALRSTKARARTAARGTEASAVIGTRYEGADGARSSGGTVPKNCRIAGAQAREMGGTEKNKGRRWEKWAWESRWLGNL